MPTGFTTVSAAHLQDATGTAISNATISFLPVANNGTPISFQSGGTAGQTIAQTVSTQVVAGAFSIQLADTSLTSPINVGYRVTVTDNVSGKVLLAAGYGCIQPTGDTWSFDTYTPNVAPQAVQVVGPRGPAGADGTDGATTPNFVAPITAPVVESVREIVGRMLLLGLNGGLRKLPTNSRGAWWGVGPALNDLRLWLAGNVLYGPTNLLPPDARSSRNGEVYLPSHTRMQRDPDSPSMRPLRTNSYGMIFGAISRYGRPIPGASWRANTDGTAQLIADTELLPASVTTTSLITGYATPPVPPQPLHNFSTGQNYYDFAHGSVTQFQYVFVPSTGQSLDTGDDTTAITTAPASTARMFNAVRADCLQTLGTSTLQPLVESNSGISGETHTSGFAAALTAAVKAYTAGDPNAPATISPICAASGIGGQVYANICGPTDYAADHVYGSPSFREMMAEVTEAVRLQPGTTVPAVTIIHGEFDGQQSNQNYGANIVTWQHDIETGCKARTNQAGTIPAVLAQTIVPLTAVQQFDAARQNPGKILLSHPSYFFPHVTGSGIASNLHITAYSQRLAGEYIAQVYRRILLERKQWFPTMPYRATVGTTTTRKPVIILDYVTPYGDPLAIDTATVTNPFGESSLSGNVTVGPLGYTFVDAIGTTILSAAQTGPHQITLYLSQVPAANGRTLYYACWAGDLQDWGGAVPLGINNGPRGCVRDNPATPRMSVLPDASGNATPLWNWAVNFKLSV